MAALAQTLIEPVAEPETLETVLVVDDSRGQLKLLSKMLGRWGYHVLEASSGEDALEICRTEAPSLIISDWMMPGMTGLEFCAEFRALSTESYGYFILLTSKSEKEDIAKGLDIGADDFLTKPVDGSELRARLRAGERILSMERELVEKNRLVTSTLAEMQILHAAIEKDLGQARQLQQSLVRDRFCQFDGADVSLLLQPAGQVGGDLVGLFPINEDEIGIYAIDVSGHGITSAMMTARLAGYVSGTSAKQNIALREVPNGRMEMRDPAEVVTKMNQLVLEEMETEHYFTLLMGKCDLKTGHVVMSQAGHPYPTIQRGNGKIEFLGDGGMPVGMFDSAEFTEFSFQLCPGDRLLLGSDGITECADEAGNMLDEEGLEKLLVKYQALKGERFFEAMMWDLTEFKGDQDFDDDISGVLLEFKGRA